MELKKNNEPIQDPNLDMGAHDPKVDMARNKNLFKKSLIFAGLFVLVLVVIVALYTCSENRAKQRGTEPDFAYTEMQAKGQARYNTTTSQYEITDSAAYENVMNMYTELAESNAAPRALVMAARYAYDNGDYEKALGFIKDVDTRSSIVQTLKFCLEGDCYVNLDKIEESINAFKEAVEEANDNPELAPYALHKLANVYRFNGNYKEEAETLKEIQNKFPASFPDIDSQIARAERMAAQ